MLYTGLNASAWILMIARGSRLMLWTLIVVQAFEGAFSHDLFLWMSRASHLIGVQPGEGVNFAAFAILIAICLSYSLFILYIRMEGLESLRMRNELKLAHGIQDTLVPPVALRSARFEVYGISYPSDKVGGDLVDALYLSNGDAVAYLADIAGHGLQAGILMGMLKTAARTALLDAGAREPHRTLPVLLDRLNRVLPEVKEPQMYATFTGLRLGEDGRAFYALAASPPILHWHALERQASHIDEPQLPLGLLPVPKFDGETLRTSPGDLLVVASDGILEVVNKPGEEYGIDRLKDLIAANADDALPELAAKILASARGFGPQFDDQTILIVRCL
jgi:serine phosphatase RsbU (regulator of sigma subunit)